MRAGGGGDLHGALASDVGREDIHWARAAERGGGEGSEGNRGRKEGRKGGPGGGIATLLPERAAAAANPELSLSSPRPRAPND